MQCQTPIRDRYSPTGIHRIDSICLKRSLESPKNIADALRREARRDALAQTLHSNAIFIAKFFLIYPGSRSISRKKGMVDAP